MTPVRNIRAEIRDVLASAGDIQEIFEILDSNPRTQIDAEQDIDQAREPVIKIYDAFFQQDDKSTMKAVSSAARMIAEMECQGVGALLRELNAPTFGYALV